MGNKIVLVDDEAEILSLVRDYLTRDGFTVVTALNGVEGMELIEKENRIWCCLIGCCRE